MSYRYVLLTLGSSTNWCSVMLLLLLFRFVCFLYQKKIIQSLCTGSLIEQAEHHQLLLGAHTGGAGLVGGVGAGNDGEGALDGRRRLRSDGQVVSLRLEAVLVGDEGQGDLFTFRRVVGPRTARRSSGFLSDLFLGSFLLTYDAISRFEPVFIFKKPDLYERLCVRTVSTATGY